VNRFQLRHAHIAIASAVVLVLLACSKSDAPPKTDTTAKAPESAAAAPSATSQPLAGAGRGLQQRKQQPGDLTKPIDDYTGAEFGAFVKKLSYVGGHERQRKCKNDPGCTGSKRTLVLVDAIATQDSLAPSTTPQFGIVYAHAINKGDAPEARYGMLPGKQYEYYMIITADSAGTGMQWRLEQYDTKAETHSKFGTGQFVACNHTWVAGARADFKTCANAAAAPGRDSVMKLGLNLQGFDGDPIWVTCSSGCCIAQ
jgi:hypothetical protein